MGKPMTKEAQPSAMRRKAGAGRPPPEIGRLTAAKAVRACVVQAADDVAGLAAAAGTVEESRTTLAPFIETVPDPALLALVEGPGGRYGMIVLDVQVVAALIEMQTTGRVVPRPAEPRAPTRTDAIMCADFIDRLLELVDQRVAEAELELAPAISGFRYGIALAEKRAIVMSLEDIPYREFRFEVDLGRGAKSGATQILLPFDPPGAARAGGAEVEAFAKAMRAQVLDSQAVLSASLFRRRMSLAEVAALEVGSLLHLPRAALTEITVEALDGTAVANGRLGQVNGHRAVRLTLPGATGASGATGAAGAIGPAASPASAPVPHPQTLEMSLPPGGLPAAGPALSDPPPPTIDGLGARGAANPGEVETGLGDLGNLTD